MKKLITGIIVAVTLAACGGGGDPEPAVNYSKYSGNYICKHVAYPGLEIPVTADFTEKSAVVMSYGTTVIYSDSIGVINNQPRWSKQLTNLRDYESVLVSEDRKMVIYIGPGSDFTKYYIDQVAFCTKL